MVSVDEVKRQSKQWNIKEDMNMSEFEGSTTCDTDGVLENTRAPALATAFESSLESKRQEALFDDELTLHLTGDKDMKVSELINFWLYATASKDAHNIFCRWRAARLKLIDDYLTMWITKRCMAGQKAQVASVGAGIDIRPFFF